MHFSEIPASKLNPRRGVISAVYYILYKGAFLGLFGVCLVWVGAPLNFKKASKKISSKDPFLTELRPMEVLHISEFSNTKFSIFSWFFRHPNRPNYISMTFPNLQNHFLMLSKFFFQSHISLKWTMRWAFIRELFWGFLVFAWYEWVHHSILRKRQKKFP